MERPRRLAETIKSGRGAVATFIKGESPGAGLAQATLRGRARRRDGRGFAAGAGAADAVARRRRELAAAVAVAPLPRTGGLAAVRRLSGRVVRRRHARAPARARVLRVVAVAAVAAGSGFAGGRGSVARRLVSIKCGADAVHGVAGESPGSLLAAGRALAVAREPAAAASNKSAVLGQ